MELFESTRLLRNIFPDLADTYAELLVAAKNIIPSTEEHTIIIQKGSVYLSLGQDKMFADIDESANIKKTVAIFGNKFYLLENNTNGEAKITIGTIVATSE